MAAHQSAMANGLLPVGSGTSGERAGLLPACNGPAALGPGLLPGRHNAPGHALPLLPAGLQRGSGHPAHVGIPLQGHFTVQPGQLGIHREIDTDQRNQLAQARQVGVYAQIGIGDDDSALVTKHQTAIAIRCGAEDELSGSHGLPQQRAREQHCAARV